MTVSHVQTASDAVFPQRAHVRRVDAGADERVDILVYGILRLAQAINTHRFAVGFVDTIHKNQQHQGASILSQHCFRHRAVSGDVLHRLFQFQPK